MTTKQAQIGNAAVYLVPLMIGNLLPIITLPIFTRLLTREDYGAIALANVYAVVVAGVAMMGLPIAYERNYFQYTEARERAQLLYSVIGYSVLAFVVAGALTWIFLGSITQMMIGDARYQQVIVWSLASTAVVGVKNYYMTYLKNEEKAVDHAKYTLAERLLGTIFTLTLVAWVGWGAAGMVAGQMLASSIVLVVLAIRFLGVLSPSVDRRLLVDSLKVGSPLMPRVFLGVVGNNIDKYLIGQVASLGGVGLYSIGQRIATIAFTYMTALQNVFGPQVYSRMFAGGPGAGASIGLYLTPFAYASTVVAAGIAIFSEEILKLLTPPTYHPAVPIVGILVLSQAIYFFGKVPQLTYARKTHLVSVIAAVSTLLNAAMGALAIWLWGTTGAAWGVLAAAVVTTAVTVVLGQRYFRVEWETRRMFAIFGLLFVTALLTIALRQLEVTYWIRGVVKLACAGAFVALGIRMNYLSAENFAVVRDIVRSRLRPRRAGA